MSSITRLGDYVLDRAKTLTLLLHGFTYLRLSRNCEWDEVRMNVDIHTLRRELRDRYNSRKPRDRRELTQFHSSTFFTKLQTTIYIQELKENVITVPSITRRDILGSFDLGLIYQHVSESFETRQEQVENGTDKTGVPFTLSFSFHLMLPRWECKPSITIVTASHNFFRREKECTSTVF